jgi:predicted nucleic acid-binding protein
MILADTSVVIEFLRTGNAKLRGLVVSTPAAICGVTRAEVLHGARDSAHRQKLVTALDLFQQVSMPEPLWDRVGDHLAALRSSGVTVPLADVVIATIAIENHLELWTRDAQFAHIQNVILHLKLFQEPP